MAIMFTKFLANLSVCLLVTVVRARDVHYVLKAGYFCGAPDGVRVCHILGLNGQFPGPTIEATIGDTLHVTLINGIRNHSGSYSPRSQSTTLHWHGIFQKGTPYQDGPEGVTQCPIPSGHRHTYIFQLQQSGTFWYHSHAHYQYTEGMWGPLIVHAKPEIYATDYDAEFTLSLSDWYHTSGQVNTEWFLSPRSGGRVPIPFSFLMNGHGAYNCSATTLPCDPRKQVPEVFVVEHGKRYRIRVINTSATTLFWFSIPGHNLTVIETDSVATVKVSYTRVPIHPGQRYSFIVEMNCHLRKNWIRAEAELRMFKFHYANINPNPGIIKTVVKARLQYIRPTIGNIKNTIEGLEANELKANSCATPSAAERNDPEFRREMLLRPQDRILAPATVDQEIVLTVMGMTDANGIWRLALNGVPYRVNHVPVLDLIAMSRPIPRDSVPIEVKFNQVVQVVINNHNTGPHPFHLHGHDFWVVGYGITNASDYNAGRDKLIRNGVRRDTTKLEPASWTVIRFITDNPGAWFFHCHINWHLQNGLAATFIEASDRIPKQIPNYAKRICKASGVEI